MLGPIWKSHPRPRLSFRRIFSRLSVVMDFYVRGVTIYHHQWDGELDAVLLEVEWGWIISRKDLFITLSFLTKCINHCATVCPLLAGIDEKRDRYLDRWVDGKVLKGRHNSASLPLGDLYNICRSNGSGFDVHCFIDHLFISVVRDLT